MKIHDSDTISFKLVNGSDKSYHCPICNKKTGALRSHLKKVHNTTVTTQFRLMNSIQMCRVCGVNQSEVDSHTLSNVVFTGSCKSSECKTKYSTENKRRLNQEVISEDGKTRLDIKNEKTRATMLKVGSDGLTKIERSVGKMIETKSQVDESGLSGFQKAIQKQVMTMKSDLDELGRNAYQRAQVNGVATKRSKVIDGKDSYTLANDKRRATLKRLGKWKEVYSKLGETLSNTLLNMSEDKMEQRLNKSLNKLTMKVYKNTELRYQSNYERKFLDELSRSGLISTVTNAPTIMNYHNRRKYYPDFYFPETNTIVEIKSTAVMMFRQSPEEVYLKFKKTIEDGYNILFVLDFKEYRFSRIQEIDEFFGSITS